MIILSQFYLVYFVPKNKLLLRVEFRSSQCQKISCYSEQNLDPVHAKELVVTQSRIQIPSTPKNQLLLRVEFISRLRRRIKCYSEQNLNPIHAKELVVTQSRIKIPSTPKNQLLLRVELISHLRQQGESPPNYGFALRKLEILAFPEMAYLDRKIYELNRQF